MIAAGQFREDLMYRIRVIHLQVPPLRARREDIRPLVEHTIQKSGRPIILSEDALKALEQYRWPGNVRQLQNLIEQLSWMSSKDEISIDDLPGALRMPAGTGILPARERRRQVADDLYHGLVTNVYTFWDHTYPLFMNRDITRHDLRELVRRGLSTTCGNYRALVKLFGMPTKDYKRFLNFLAAHDCRVDFREFRTGNEHVPAPRPPTPITDGVAPADRATVPDRTSPSRPRPALTAAATIAATKNPANEGSLSHRVCPCHTVARRQGARWSVGVLRRPRSPSGAHMLGTARARRVRRSRIRRPGPHPGGRLSQGGSAR